MKPKRIPDYAAKLELLDSRIWKDQIYLKLRIYNTGREAWRHGVNQPFYLRLKSKKMPPVTTVKYLEPKDYIDVECSLPEDCSGHKIAMTREWRIWLDKDLEIPEEFEMAPRFSIRTAKKRFAERPTVPLPGASTPKRTKTSKRTKRKANRISKPKFDRRGGERKPNPIPEKPAGSRLHTARRARGRSKPKSVPVLNLLTKPYSVGIIVLNFMREQQLKHALPTLTKQKFPGMDVDILVVNDGLPGKCEEICDKHGVRHIFTGQRNLKKMHWRCMGFAANVGIKQAKGDIVIITEAEIYHFGNTIKELAYATAANSKLLSIPSQLWRDKGDFLKTLEKGRADGNKGRDQNATYPYLMAIRRENIMAIGGFDEDFTGRTADDTDFRNRLRKYGCKIHRVSAEAIHLYHDRTSVQHNADKNSPGRKEYNHRLLTKKRGTIVRNQGREWGAFTPPPGEDDAKKLPVSAGNKGGEKIIPSSDVPEGNMPSDVQEG